MAPQTTAGVYDRYMRHLWDAWCKREGDTNAIGHWYPRNGWDGWYRIKERATREYDRIEHRTHTGSFRPLWCGACQSSNG